MKMSRRNRGSVEDMIQAFQNKIDELEGSDIHSSRDVATKEYRYVTKHGLGPGMMPKDVTLIRSEDLDNYKTAIYIDRPLSKEELDYYDIYPEWIQSGTQMYDEDDPVDMENEDEVRDAVAMYLSTMNIDPMKFEDVVDNYVDLIMDHGYDSIQEWWDEFVDSDEMEQLRSMGYISDDIDECDHSVNDEYDIVTI